MELPVHVVLMARFASQEHRAHGSENRSTLSSFSPLKVTRIRRHILTE